jgi:hypothetical protein
MAAKQEPCARATGTKSKLNKIATLNDAFRQTCSGGTLMATPGVIALGWAALPQIVQAVRSFDEFSTDNDPHGEHDFGAIEWRGQRLFWKIDCYDPDMRFGSADPSDPSVTARVLTIMLAEEY